MTINHTSYIPNNDGIALSLSVHRKPRFNLRNGKLWLFWDASKLTDKRQWAWIGTRDQARACKRKFEAAAGCKLSPHHSMQEHGA